MNRQMHGSSSSNSSSSSSSSSSSNSCRCSFLCSTVFFLFSFFSSLVSHLFLCLVIRLVHLQCESLLFSVAPSVCLSVCRLSVPRQISITKRDRREVSSPLQEIRVRDQEYDVRFCTGSIYIPPKNPKTPK